MTEKGSDTVQLQVWMDACLCWKSVWVSASFLLGADTLHQVDTVTSLCSQYVLILYLEDDELVLRE